MTDADKQRLAELARAYLKADADYDAAENAFEACRIAVSDAQREIAAEMEAMGLTYIVVDESLVFRDGNRISANPGDIAILD